MIPNHFKRAVWGILMAAAGDRQRGDLLAATGEDLMTVDTVRPGRVDCARIRVCERRTTDAYAS